jgi:hypothetical protein
MRGALFGPAKHLPNSVETNFVVKLDPLYFSSPQIDATDCESHTTLTLGATGGTIQ